MRNNGGGDQLQAGFSHEHYEVVVARIVRKSRSPRLKRNVSWFQML
jgi:hypothetical protein